MAEKLQFETFGEQRAMIAQLRRKIAADCAIRKVPDAIDIERLCGLYELIIEQQQLLQKLCMEKITTLEVDLEECNSIGAERKEYN